MLRWITCLASALLTIAAPSLRAHRDLRDEFQRQPG